jgi:hypothetical protein
MEEENPVAKHQDSTSGSPDHSQVTLSFLHSLTLFFSFFKKFQLLIFIFLFNRFSRFVQENRASVL